MNELKPCPFCGKTADIITGVSCYSESFAYVQCLFCRAQSRAFYDRGHPRAVFDEAVEAWNRRKSEKTNENDTE